MARQAPGRSGKAYADWLKERGDAFRAGVEVATLDPFHGYKNAIDNQLEDAVAVLDAFHVVKLGTDAVDACRRRVQQATRGHRGRKGDALYGIRMLLRAGGEKPPDRQRRRLAAAIGGNEAHLEVWLAWACAQTTPSRVSTPQPSRGTPDRRAGRGDLPDLPRDRDRPLGRTLRQWKTAFLAYFDTGRASNGGTEAINGLIELHRRIARGVTNRDNYRLRMLLIGGGLRTPT